MLFAKKTAAEKRASFREELATGRLLQFPGAYSPIVSLAIEDQGFDGVYISGAALSAELGMPDIGLTTLTEVTQRGRQIARVTDLPALMERWILITKTRALPPPPAWATRSASSTRMVPSS